MYDFTGIGNACLDLISPIEDDMLKRFQLEKSHQITIDTKTKETLIEALPSISYSLGGAASNVCHVISSLGGSSAFMGRLADDHAGQLILKGLADTNIAYPMAPIYDTSLDTAQIFCLTTPDAERSFASYYGISNEISIEDIDIETIKKSKIVYLDGYCLYSPHAKKAFDTVIDTTKDSDTLSIFHCGDVSVIKNYKEDALDLIQKADIVIFNKKEATVAFPHKSIEDIVKDLSLEKDAGAVTLGKDGAYIFQHGKILKVDAQPTIAPIIDTCGAGDHFSGGLLFGLINGFSLEKSGELATLCARDVMSHFGARPLSSLKPLIDQI